MRLMNIAKNALMVLSAFFIATGVAAATEQTEVFVQTGHTMSTTAVDYSPNAQRLISCDGSGSVIAWDAESGLQYRGLYRHLGFCLNTAFSRDGQRVYSTGGAKDGQQLVETDYSSGSLRQVWTGHTGLIVGMLVKEDGVWTLGESDGLKFWQAGRSKAVRTVPLPAMQFGNASQLAGTEHSSSLWVGNRLGQVLEVPESGKPRLLASLGEEVSSLAVSPDGAHIAVGLGTFMGSQNRAIVLIDSISGKVIRSLEGHAGSPVSIAFSPDGKTLGTLAQIDLQKLMTGSAGALAGQEELRLWSVDTGQLLSIAINERNALGTPFIRAQLKFSRDGQSLAVAAWDEAVRLYALPFSSAELKSKRVLEGRGAPALQVALDEQGKSLAISAGRPRNKIAAEYYEAAQLIQDFGGESNFTREQLARLSVLYGPKGFRKHRQTVSVWDLSDGQMKSTVNWQLGPTSWLAPSKGGSGFVSLAPLFPNTVTVSPLKSRLIREASLLSSGETRFKHFSYERNQGEPDRVTDEMVQGGDESYAVDLTTQNRDGTVTAVASTRLNSDPAQRDHRVHLLMNKSGTRQLPGEWPLPGKALAMTLSPDGQILWMSISVQGALYSDNHQGRAIALDTRTGQVLGQWNLPKGVTSHQMAVHSGGRGAVFSGDSRLLVAQIGRKALSRQVLWRKADRPVTALGVSADGNQLAVSNTAGQTARLDWSKVSLLTPKWSGSLSEPFPSLWAWSADQKVLVAASDDGRVRMLDPASGKTFLNLFQFDEQEWLSISNEGYFAASSKGDEWINVRVNQQVYRIGQFYDVFYRPDVVQRGLQRLPIADLVSVTLEDAIKRPPPRVNLSGASSADKNTAEIKLDLQNSGGGIGEVRLLLNGKLLARENRAIDQIVNQRVSTPSSVSLSAAKPEVVQTGSLRALKLASKKQVEKVRQANEVQQLAIERSVSLAPGDNEIAVMALNAAGDLSSRPTRVSLFNPAVAKPPTLWLLSVGINQFKANPQAPNLNFAVKDAQRFSRELALPLARAVKAARTETIELIDVQATREGLQQALNRVAEQSSSEDVFVWFVASHGTLDDLAQYGMVLHDWNGSTSPGQLFSSDEILNAATRIKAARQLLILDTCHAGGLNGWLRGLFDARFSVLARNSGLHLFASAGETQQALDGYQGNGLYTHVLLKSIQNPQTDQNQDGQIDTSEWGAIAKQETSRLARILRHQQEPMMMNFGKEIPVYEKP